MKYISVESRLFQVFVTLILSAMPLTAAFAQSDTIGDFEGSGDVGNVKHPGSVVYDANDQSYTVSGSGSNMWFDRDSFFMIWKKLDGDFILTADAELLGKGVDPHRKMGWIVRSSLDSNAAYVDVAVHGDGLTSMQYRPSKGANTEEVKSSLTGARVIQLSRKGSTFTMAVAHQGELFVSDSLAGVDLGDEVYVGLFVCSHNPDVLEKARFHNVRITLPVPAHYVPYRDYIGSNLEVMDIATGHRTIVYQHPKSIQAPNWTRDGRALIYNGDGALYRFDLATRQPEKIDTDFATNNNNDHVLSFDGKKLGISHHSVDHDNQSIVYTVPVEGGKPRQITETGPSYLHGWSPDGKWLIYTAERNGDYDIYRIPSDGGREENLTRSPGLDDGSEYSPDGKYIYFNSVRSGLMHLWRMKADGSDPEQLTDDAFNNWFPHVSPDGKSLVFLSFHQDVAPSDHPFYKHVYLRLMPVEGGKSRVLAWLYGGQGTINVPSWSPDGKKIAFVSNTDGL